MIKKNYLKKASKIATLILFGSLLASIPVKNPLEKIIEFQNHQEINYQKTLNKEKKEQLEKDFSNYLKENKVSTVEDAIQYSLDFVSNNLDFRLDYFLGKKGKNYFHFPTEVKNTDCRDYSFLFDKTFSYVCETLNWEGVSSKIMRSKDAKLFGYRIDDHDWVKITDENTKKVWNLDPTFYDLNFSSNLEKMIK